jgi:hypothetical protein
MLVNAQKWKSGGSIVNLDVLSRFSFPGNQTNRNFFIRRNLMGKYLIGWLLGVPVIVLVIIYLFFN